VDFAYTPGPALGSRVVWPGANTPHPSLADPQLPAALDVDQIIAPAAAVISSADVTSNANRYLVNSEAAESTARLPARWPWTVLRHRTVQRAVEG
jgi:hypothetical protein